ncbi:hypothetical protein THAOC_08367, partial [Thalassiosira oceanica]
MFTTGANGIANNYRSSKGGETVHIQTSLFRPDPRVWLRIAKSADVFTTYYKPAETSYWYQFGARLSLPRIDQNGVYFVGIAISSHSTTDFATAEIGSIQITRTCVSTTDRMQCDQASNCDLGYVTGTCYDEGTRPDWELTELTNNVLDYGSHTEAVGCLKTWRFSDEEDGNLLTDGLTNEFKCNIDAEETGMIFQPSHGRFSLAKAIRFYANKDCLECDPVSYVLKGRRNTIDYPLMEPQYLNSTEADAEEKPILINNVTLDPSDGGAIQVSDFDGKFMIAGAPVHEAAYIFELIDENQTWVEVALLLPEGGKLGVYRGDAFGCSVAISGTTAIVGTCAVDDFFGYIGQGEAYVFVQDESVANGTVWTQQAKITNAPSPNCYQKSVQSGADQYLYEICIGESGVSSQTLVSSTPSVVTSLGTYAGAEGWNTGLVSLFWTDGDSVGCAGLNRGASVEMTCGETTQIMSISQPSICYYFIEMEGPDACLSTNSPTQSVTSVLPMFLTNIRKLEYQRDLQGGTNSPTVSAVPSDSPVTAEPTGQPSKSPVTSAPSDSPVTSKPSKSPTDAPSDSPVTSEPSKSPV